MKIYSDELNGRRTSVSFAYYPQFWLPENKRPVFVKALYQLIARYFKPAFSMRELKEVGNKELHRTDSFIVFPWGGQYVHEIALCLDVTDHNVVVAHLVLHLVP